MPDTLAIHGGPAVRTKPFPAWPIFAEEEEQALLRTLHSGRRGRLDGDVTGQQAACGFAGAANTRELSIEPARHHDDCRRCTA
jgi:hypothetical protein